MRSARTARGSPRTSTSNPDALWPPRRATLQRNLRGEEGELLRDDGHLERIGGLAVEALEVAVRQRKETEHVVRGTHLLPEFRLELDLGFLAVAHDRGLIEIPCLRLGRRGRLPPARGDEDENLPRQFVQRELEIPVLGRDQIVERPL